MRFPSDVVENWAMYGLPRCGDYRCRRLLWPWFEIGGNGEEPLCMDCTDAIHLRHEMEDNRYRDSGSFVELDTIR